MFTVYALTVPDIILPPLGARSLGPSYLQFYGIFYGQCGTYETYGQCGIPSYLRLSRDPRDPWRRRQSTVIVQSTRSMATAAIDAFYDLKGDLRVLRLQKQATRSTVITPIY